MLHLLKTLLESAGGWIVVAVLLGGSWIAYCEAVRFYDRRKARR